MRSSRLHVAALGVALTGCVLSAQVPVQRPEAADFLRRAREVVEDALRESKVPVTQFRTEVAVPPVMPPENGRLRRPPVQPGSGQAELSGRVLNERWEPIAGAVVSIGASGNPSQTRTAVTDAEGGFQILNLAPATYNGLVKAGDEEIARIVDLGLVTGHHRVLATTGIGLHLLFEGKDAASPSVLFASYRGSNLVRLDLVKGDEPELKETVTSGEGLPTDAEWKQVRSEIAPFLAALYDITLGTQRFEQFLHPRVACQLYYSGERSIATISERRCMTSVLENMALWSLLSFEGFENQGVASRDLGDPFFLQPRKATDDERMAVLLRRHDVLRNELFSAVRDPDHFARVRQYLQMSMSAIPIRVVSMLPDEMLNMVPELRGKTLYIVGGAFLFTREGGQLRLAAIIAAGG